MFIPGCKTHTCSNARVRRAATASVSLLGAIGLLAATASAMFAGAGPAWSSKDRTFAEKAKLIRPSLPIRGVVRPAAQATITTELIARVSKVTFREGQTFRAGERLISFDCSRHHAELASLKAQRREMLVAYQSASLLVRRNVGARQDVEISLARLDRATANLKALEIRLKQCEITAPFDGSVTKLSINEHETSRNGKPLISIVSIKDPEIELIVPSTFLAWLKPGAEFQFQVRDIDASFPGRVTRVSAAVDAVSQTFKVFGRFTKPTPGVVPGVSGRAKFNGNGN